LPCSRSSNLLTRRGCGDASSSAASIVASSEGKGIAHHRSATLGERESRAIYRSGFWIRDLEYLKPGPKVSVNKDYFEIDGKPLAVIGTTYMSSEVQRLYFEHPNAYVWDQDLAQISSAGLNMIAQAGGRVG